MNRERLRAWRGWCEVKETEESFCAPEARGVRPAVHAVGRFEVRHRQPVHQVGRGFDCEIGSALVGQSQERWFAVDHSEFVETRGLKFVWALFSRKTRS